jgi:hypothetical protein
VFRTGEADPEPPGESSPDGAPLADRHPHLSGDIGALLSTAPVFGRALFGYQRLQVENYVNWAETELLAAGREADDLLSRYGQCFSELEIAHKLLEHSPEGQELSHLTERLETMLQLAADEAADRVAAGAAEAERIIGDAAIAADARMRKAQEFEEHAVQRSEELRTAAEQDRARAASERAEAVTLLDRAGKRAGDALRVAEHERDSLARQAAEERKRLDEEAMETRARLDREAAESRDRATAESAERIRQEEARIRQEQEAAAERLAAVQAEAEEVQRQRDRAQASLARLGEQIGEALGTLTEELPAGILRLPVSPARVASHRLATGPDEHVAGSGSA